MKASKLSVLLVFNFLIFLYGAVLCFGQGGVSINTSGAAANNSAMLDVSASDKGIMIPNVSLDSTTDISTVPGAAVSLMVYNKNASMKYGTGIGFYWWDCSVWRPVISPLTSGSTGQVLTSQGSSAPQWTTPAGGGGCPAGYTSVNSQLCIEISPHDYDSWYNAVETCMTNNAHLCSWGEWYGACVMNSNVPLNPQIYYPTGDDATYEWVDDAGKIGDGHSYGDVVIIGYNGVCTDFSAGYVDPPFLETWKFRCCYNK